MRLVYCCWGDGYDASSLLSLRGALMQSMAGSGYLTSEMSSASWTTYLTNWTIFLLLGQWPFLSDVN